MAGIGTATPAATYVGGNTFYNEILTEEALPLIIDGIYNENTLLGIFRSRPSAPFEGRAMQWKVKKSRGTGGYAKGPDGKLPVPGTRTYDTYVSTVRHNRARILVDKVVDLASATQRASWLNSMKADMEGAVEDCKWMMNRQLHNDGSGIIATTGAGNTYTPGAQTWTIANSQPGVESSGTGMPSFDPTVNLVVGKRYALIEPGGTPAVDNVFTVTSITNATTIVVNVESNSAGDTGDYIVEYGYDDAAEGLKSSGYQREVLGIAGIFSDADPGDATAGIYWETAGIGAGPATGGGVVDFQNIASAGNPFNQGIVLANSGTPRALTMELFDLAASKPMQEWGRECDIMLGSWGMWRTFNSLLMAMREFNSTSSAPVKFDGKVMPSFNNRTIVPDRHCYTNRIYFGVMDLIHFSMMRDWSWLDDDGSILSRLENSEQFQATLAWDGNVRVDMRGPQTLLCDLIEVS